jgi:hypothetical protein
MSIFAKPKITPPPSTPTVANASVYQAGQQASRGYTSLVSSAGGQGGLTRKASTVKKSLIGGM